MVSYTGIIGKLGVSGLHKAFRYCEEAKRWAPTSTWAVKKLDSAGFDGAKL